MSAETLAHASDTELDRLFSAIGFDWVWFLSIWQTCLKMSSSVARWPRLWDSSVSQTRVLI